MTVFFLLLSLLFIIMPAPPISGCTMEPSVWKQIESVDQGGDIGIYAMTDALLQFKDKFEREMAACKLPSGPITVIAAFKGENPSAIDADFHDSLSTALKVVWPDAKLLMPASMPGSLNEFTAIASIAANLADGYAVSFHFKGIRSTSINLADQNFKLFQLYRLVIREEASMFVRVTDRHGVALFLDEFTVSPTILVDALISPLGGFIIRLEKNSVRPLVVDFGPVSDGGEHVIRFNDAFHQPSIVPPLPENLPGPAACPHNLH